MWVRANTEHSHVFQFFKLRVLADDQSILNVEDIYDNLLAIVESSLEKVIPVGILTSEHRDTWAQSYQILEKGEFISDFRTNDL